jgi:hypothetical protein
MAHDDQFTALGPPLAGSGHPRTAFSTKATGMEYGGNMQGVTAGLYAQSPETDTAREADVPGVGVFGVGDNFGIFGKTEPSPGRPGIAGLFGQHNRGGVGAIGATMRGGIGVVGTSVKNLLSPLGTFGSGPGPGDGSGTGVLGTSGSGVGVHGISRSAEGVRGESAQGDAVVGHSVSGRGGRFQSGRTAAGAPIGQISLVPQPLSVSGRITASPTMYDGTALEQLPAEGSGGDLLVTRSDDGTCALWFCTNSAQQDRRAVWREVLLGPPPVPQAVELVDWTVVEGDPATGNAQGTWHGADVRLVGPMGTGSTVDGTFRGFSSSAFTPPLPSSDALEVRGGTAHAFTLTFAAAIKDPVLHLASMGSIMQFPAGTEVTLVSGQGMSVSGSTVTGLVGPVDSSGTIRLAGVFTTISFTATTNVPTPGVIDGILLQIGGLPA